MLCLFIILFQIKGKLYFLALYLVVSADYMINNTSNNSDCQLWHFLKMDTVLVVLEQSSVTNNLYT